MVAFVGNTLASNAASSATIAVTPSPALTNGNTAVVHVSCVDTATTCTLKDNNNVAYTAIDSVVDVPNSSVLFSFRSPTGGVAGSPTSLTATFNVATTTRGILVQEWSGIDVSASPLDGHDMATKAASTTPTSNSITTTANGDLIIGAVNVDGTVATITAAGSGYTLRNNDTVTQSADESQVQAAAGAITASFTISASGATIVSIIAFKAAAAAAGGGGGLPVHLQNFKIDKFKTPLRSMGPNAGLFQVKAFPIVTPAAVVETNIHWQGRTYAPQWNRNALLLSGASQDFTSSAVETNPHWQGRTWSRQWNINDSPSLLWNSASDVSVTPTVDDPTYFVPRLWRPQWNINDSPSLLWNSTGDVPSTVDAPLPFIPKIWPPQWILNKILRQNTAQDFSSSAVETNVHFIPRIWPLQWLAYRALWQNPATDAQVVVIPPDAPTYFTPVQFPWQWVINLLLTTSPANDATSSVIETNPQWVGRVYPRQWQAQPSLWQVLATDAPVVASQPDTPSYLVPRQLPVWWGVNRLLGRNTANDFSSSAVDTPSYQNPKAWPPQWASKWNVNMLLTRGTAQDFSSTPPVSTAIEWYVRYRRRGR